MTARPIAVFQQAAILATSGQYRSANEVELEFIRRGRPQGIADLPLHQRSYVDELCARSSGDTSQD
jgi:hypothetical protein